MKKGRGRPKKGWIKFSSTLSPESYNIIDKIKLKGEQFNHFFDRLIKKEAKRLDIKTTKE